MQSVNPFLSEGTEHWKVLGAKKSAVQVRVSQMEPRWRSLGEIIQKLGWAQKPTVDNVFLTNKNEFQCTSQESIQGPPWRERSQHS